MKKTLWLLPLLLCGCSASNDKILKVYENVYYAFNRENCTYNVWVNDYSKPYTLNDRNSTIYYSNDYTDVNNLFYVKSNNHYTLVIFS